MNREQWKEISLYRESLLKSTEKLAHIINKTLDLKYRQFTIGEKDEIEGEALEWFQDYCRLCVQSETLKLDEKCLPEMKIVESKVDELFDELKKIRRLQKRQEVTKEFRVLKQRFYAVSNSDTCMKYMKLLDNYARQFQKKLNSDKAKHYLKDLVEELKDLLERVSQYRSNTKKQVAIEAFSGTLTLGSSVAGGVLGAVGIAARAASTAACGSSTALGGAANAAGTATKAAGTVVNAVDAALTASASAGSITAETTCSVAKAVETAVNVGKGVMAAGGALKIIWIDYSICSAGLHQRKKSEFKHKFFCSLKASSFNSAQNKDNIGPQICSDFVVRDVFEKLLEDDEDESAKDDNNDQQGDKGSGDKKEN